MAEKWGLTARYSTSSHWIHMRRPARRLPGVFDSQIVAIKDPDGNVMNKDEGIRLGTTLRRWRTQAGVQRRTV